jgi:hypothetical protein
MAKEVAANPLPTPVEDVRLLRLVHRAYMQPAKRKPYSSDPASEKPVQLTVAPEYTKETPETVKEHDEVNFMMLGYFHQLTYLRNNDLLPTDAFGIRNPFKTTNVPASSQQLITLMRVDEYDFRKDAEDDPFEKKSKAHPFLSLIFVSYSYPSDALFPPPAEKDDPSDKVKEFLDASRAELQAVINKMKDEQSTVTLFQTMNLGDFCVAIRSKNLLFAHKLALAIEAIGEQPRETLGKVRYKTSLMFGVALPSDISDKKSKKSSPVSITHIYANEDKDKGKVRILLRLYGSSKKVRYIAAQLKKAGFPDVNIQEELMFSHAYEFASVFISMEEFVKLFDVLARFQFHSIPDDKNRYKDLEEKLETIATLLRDEMADGIMIKVRFSHDADDEPAEKPDTTALVARNNYVTQRLNEIREKMRAIQDPKVLPETLVAPYRDAVRQLDDLRKTFIPLWYHEDAHVNCTMFYVQLCVVLDAIKKYLDKIKDINDNESRVRICGNLIKQMSIFVVAANSFQKVIQSANFTAAQEPNYEIQTRVDSEKYLIAYTEFVRSLLKAFFEQGQNGDNKIGHDRTWPIFYVDHNAEKISAKTIFTNPAEDKNYVRLVAIALPSIEALSQGYDTIPALMHEALHLLRFAHIDDRNKMLIRMSVRQLTKTLLDHWVANENKDGASDGIYSPTAFTWFREKMINIFVDVFADVFEKKVKAEEDAEEEAKKKNEVPKEKPLGEFYNYRFDAFEENLVQLLFNLFGDDENTATITATEKVKRLKKIMKKMLHLFYGRAKPALVEHFEEDELRVDFVALEDVLTEGNVDERQKLFVGLAEKADYFACRELASALETFFDYNSDEKTGIDIYEELKKEIEELFRRKEVKKAIHNPECFQAYEFYVAIEEVEEKYFGAVKADKANKDQIEEERKSREYIKARERLQYQMDHYHRTLGQIGFLLGEAFACIAQLSAPERDNAAQYDDLRKALMENALTRLRQELKELSEDRQSPYSFFQLSSPQGQALRKMFGLFYDEDANIFTEKFRLACNNFSSPTLRGDVKAALQSYREMTADLGMCALMGFDAFGYFLFATKRLSEDVATDFAANTSNDAEQERIKLVLSQLLGDPTPSDESVYQFDMTEVIESAKTYIDTSAKRITEWLEHDIRSCSKGTVDDATITAITDQAGAVWESVRKKLIDEVLKDRKRLDYSKIMSATDMDNLAVALSELHTDGDQPTADHSGFLPWVHFKMEIDRLFNLVRNILMLLQDKPNELVVDKRLYDLFHKEYKKIATKDGTKYTGFTWYKTPACAPWVAEMLKYWGLADIVEDDGKTVKGRPQIRHSEQFKKTLSFVQYYYYANRLAFTQLEELDYSKIAQEEAHYKEFTGDDSSKGGDAT